MLAGTHCSQQVRIQLVKTPEVPRKRLRGGLGERAYQSLKRAICGGSILPRERLVEAAVSEWLNISRTPVREALRRLQSEGFLEHAPGGGLHVVSYDLDSLTELYFVRETVEGAAAKLCARNASDSEVRLLQQMIDDQRSNARDGESYSRRNVQFHDLIYRSARNRFLLKVLLALQDSVLLLGRGVNTTQRIKQAIAEHSEIVDAIARRDPEAAEAAARRHIHSGYQHRLDHYPPKS
jgi:DNA-binding GntR family transcriptional regulator